MQLVMLMPVIVMLPEKSTDLDTSKFPDYHCLYEILFINQVPFNLYFAFYNAGGKDAKAR
jgi:hypothetical protein